MPPASPRAAPAPRRGRGPGARGIGEPVPPVAWEPRGPTPAPVWCWARVPPVSSPQPSCTWHRDAWLAWTQSTTVPAPRASSIGYAPHHNVLDVTLVGIYRHLYERFYALA